MPSPDRIRNIAIIAHVDHGKTTLVDHMLRQSGTFRENEALQDRVMDSMDLERERGITILAKNTAVQYGDIKINIVDTPGHADFGGEVERALMMVDGALLLVDASEGPLPQTRFVLGKALADGLAILVCINKIDRPDARADEVLQEIYDLFIDLGANEEQLEFPVLYACAKDGYAHREFSLEPGDLIPLLDDIVQHVPPPEGRDENPLRVLVTQLDYDSYVGRLAIGRIYDGSIARHSELALVGEEETTKVKVVQLYTFQGLARTECDRAVAGDIVAIAGIDAMKIGDTLTERDRPHPLPRLKVEEPTIGVTFLANTGPLSGRSGKYLTAREIRDRLERECRYNVAVRIDEQGPVDQIRLYGRGELQIAILIEQMRREGFEMCVSKPEVLTRTVDEKLYEPWEIALLDLPQEFLGMVTERMSLRKGRMINMKVSGSGRVRVEFRVPSRGLIGFRGAYLNDTRGMGIFNRIFDAWDTHAGYIPYRMNGSLVNDRAGQTTTYALYHLQPRGKLFVVPGLEVYEGMIVGENARQNDINVNACRSKQLTNVRSSGADEKLILAPPLPLTLEKAFEFISDDELVEITPGSIRLRKKELRKNHRSVVRGERKEKR
jgi:GTP-binding protein